MRSALFMSTITVILFIILLAGCSGEDDKNVISTGYQGESIPHVKGESGPVIDDYKDKDFDKFISALKNAGMINIADTLTDKIKASELEIRKWGFGYIIVGRIIVDGPEDPRDVEAQMEILEEGYFADSVKDLLRPVGFRLNRYMPFDLELNGMKGKTGAVINVGTIHLTLVPAGELANLKGKIILDGDFDPATAKITLTTGFGPVNTPHNGVEGRDHWPEPLKVAVLPSGDFFCRWI